MFAAGRAGLRSWVVLVVVVLVLSGCARDAKTPAPTTSGSQGPSFPEVPAGTTRFVVLGDQGTGGEAQRKVAAAIGTVCRERGCQYAIVAGDNLYESGATGPDDPQFATKFEDVYADLPFDFFLVLGNHDNGDGLGTRPEAGDHEVAYSKRTGRPSTKWHMEARNYVLVKGDVTFLAMDSGPGEVSLVPAWPPGGRGEALKAFVDAHVPKITTKWRLAFAHHPYVSNAQHGDAGSFDNVPGSGLAYKQMWESSLCGKVQVFFAGHDHSLQWLKPVASCGATEFIVSGAGGAAIYSRKSPAASGPARFEDFSHHGFWWVDVTGGTMTLAAYSDEAKERYNGTLRV